MDDYTIYKGHLPVDDLFLGRVPEMASLRNYFAHGGQIAQINGAAGTGKTTLAKMFAHESGAFYPGGIFHSYAFPAQSFLETIASFIGNSITHPTLLIIDEAHLLSPDDFLSVDKLLDDFPQLNLIFVSQLPLPLKSEGSIQIQLGPLRKEDFVELINKRFKYVDPTLLSRFYDLAGGNPLSADVATRSIRENLLSWNQLIRAFGEFEFDAVRGPKGTPIDSTSASFPRIILAVNQANEELLAKIKSNPELLRSLPPRKFEEVVAEILERLGFEIELTPISHDGGFDMYAAKNETIGHFLYLVECKRYIPPSKVGVSIVRSLHGVVQQKQANAGIIVTTSLFSRDAEEFQQQIKYQIHLQDYVALQQWLKLI